MNISIGRKLSFILSALIIFGAAVLITTGLVHQRENLLENVQEGNTVISEMLSVQLAGGLRWKNERAIRAMYSKILDTHERISTIATFTEDGRLVTQDNATSSHGYTDIESFFLERYKDIDTKTKIYNINSHIITISPIFLPRTGKHVGYLAVAWSQKAFQQSLSTLIITQLIVLSCIVLIILVLMNYILQRLLIHPLGFISSLMGKITNSYNITIPSAYLERKDELGSLAHSFNEMILKIKGRDLNLKTQKQKAEIARQKAEEANIAKRDFLANMSHEIRTPMNGIIGTTDLLIGTKLSEQQFDYVTTVQRSADALLMIINDILDFTKIEAGELTLEPTAFNLETLLHDSINIFNAVAASKGLMLIMRFDPYAPRHVIGDSVRIRQVINNLISNAIKFTEKGYIFVNVIHDKNKGFILSVEDTGIGIPKNKQEKIFDRFTQADASTTRKYGGTGLGLSICSQLVQIMSGTLSLESEEGIGSTFTITLNIPLNSEQEETGLEEIVLLKKYKIFLIDKHEKPLSILNEILIALGAEDIEAYTNPHQLIRTLTERKKELEHAHTLLVSGYELQEMSGESLGKQVKLNPEYKQMRMLVLPAMGSKLDMSGIAEAHFDACLMRPTKQAVFASVIKQICAETYQHQKGNIYTGTSQISEQNAERQKPLPHSLNILVAEDDPVNQKVIQALLRDLGYEPRLAQDGFEALEWIEKESFDLIFMDMQMPEMDGTETTRKIRALETSRNLTPVPIFALTANVMKEHRDLCLEAGMNDYLSKPVTKSKLRSILSEWQDKLKKENTKPLPKNKEEKTSSTHNPVQKTALPEEKTEVVNRDVLRNVIGESTTETKEFLTLYVKSAYDVIRLLETSFIQQDKESFFKAIHRLKGSSMNFGAPFVEAQCKQAEENADAAFNKETISALNTAVKHIETYIEEALS